MSTTLNFSNNYFKENTINKKNNSYYSERTANDAFLFCIKGLPYKDLDNLCKLIQEYYASFENPINLSIEECYELTQGNNTNLIIVDNDFKTALLNLAYKCIHSGNHLGNNTINEGKINTSSWVSHSLFQGEAASNIAMSLGLDSDTAQKLGILHDIGRKYTHTFEHTVKGYEALISEGWNEEALCCLTHSFLGDFMENGTTKGCRCANCDPASEGFYVDENGNPSWMLGTKKDDITLFLENYNYNDYDLILNIADLMATDRGIMSPYDRVSDVATRKTPDPTNRVYFKTSFVNLLIYFLEKMNNISLNRQKLKATPNVSDEEIDSIFFNTSSIFFNAYNELKKKEEMNKKL